MKSPDAQTPGNHPQSLLLPYVEEELDAESRSAVERHVQTCGSCAGDLQELGEIIGALKKHKDAFCPEPWQLFELAESGHDPTSELAGHVDQCPLCRQELAMCRIREVPAGLHAKIQEACEQQFAGRAKEKRAVQWKEMASDFLDGISFLLRPRMMPVFATAAAILLVVFIYPRDALEPMMRLSSVTWDQQTPGLVPKAIFTGKPKPRLAMVLFFAGFKEPVPQAKVDSLYGALKPSQVAKQDFEIVSPASVQEAIGAKNVTGANKKEIAETLRTNLKITRMIAVTVLSKKEGFDLDGEMIEAETGATTGKSMARGVKAADLESKLGESVLTLMGADRADK